MRNLEVIANYVEKLLEHGDFTTDELKRILNNLDIDLTRQETNKLIKILKERGYDYDEETHYDVEALYDAYGDLMEDNKTLSDYTDDGESRDSSYVQAGISDRKSVKMMIYNKFLSNLKNDELEVPESEIDSYIEGEFKRNPDYYSVFRYSDMSDIFSFISILYANFVNRIKLDKMASGDSNKKDDDASDLGNGIGNI